MKNGKEIKLKKFKKYNVVYGTVDSKKTKTLYITISSWVEPKINEEIDYSKINKIINKKLKQVIFNHLNHGFQPNFNRQLFIVDFDIKESGIKYGKRSYMKTDITLFVDDEIIFKSEKTKDYLENLTETIINNVFETNEHFEFYSKKVSVIEA